LSSKILPDSLKWSTYITGFNRSGIITQFHLVCIGTKNSNGFDLFCVKWKNFTTIFCRYIILKQNRRLCSNYQSQFIVKGIIYYLRSDLRIWNHRLRIKFPKPHPDSKHIDKGPIDISFRYQASFKGLYSINLVFTSTVRIHSSNKTKSSCFNSGTYIFMSLPDISNCTTVTGNVSLHTKSPPCNSINKEGAG